MSFEISIDTACFCDRHLTDECLGPECAICKAIQVERELCAKVLDEMESEWHKSDEAALFGIAATRIRARAAGDAVGAPGGINAALPPSRAVDA